MRVDRQAVSLLVLETRRGVVRDGLLRVTRRRVKNGCTAISSWTLLGSNRACWQEEPPNDVCPEIDSLSSTAWKH